METGLDQSAGELAASIGEFPNDDPADGDRIAMLYARGAMIAYVFDRELAARGASLDLLMRQLFERGLADKDWTQSDLADVAEALTGNQMEDWLGAYVGGNTRLPVAGPFELVPR